MITPRTPPRAGPMVLQSTKQHSQSVNDMILIFQINSIIKYANKISALQETRSLGGLPHSDYGEIILLWYLPVVQPMVVDGRGCKRVNRLVTWFRVVVSLSVLVVNLDRVLADGLVRHLVFLLTYFKTSSRLKDTKWL